MEVQVAILLRAPFTTDLMNLQNTYPHIQHPLHSTAHLQNIQCIFETELSNNDYAKSKQIYMSKNWRIEYKMRSCEVSADGRVVVCFDVGPNGQWGSSYNQENHHKKDRNWR